MLGKPQLTNALAVWYVRPRNLHVAGHCPSLESGTSRRLNLGLSKGRDAAESRAVGLLFIPALNCSAIHLIGQLCLADSPREDPPGPR